MKNNLIPVLLKQLNIYDKNVPIIYDFNELDDLNLVDKELNKNVLKNILLPLKIFPVSKEDFINKMRLLDIYLIIDAVLTIRGLKQKWENTFLSYDEVVSDEIGSRIKILFHYLYTAFEILGFANSYDFVLSKFSKEDITVYTALQRANKYLSLIIKENSDLFKYEEIKFNIVENLDYLKNHIINSKTRINPYIFKYLEVLIVNNKLKNIDINEIKFKENKNKVIDIFIKNNYIDFTINNIEDVLRMMVYKIVGVPTLIYTNQLKETKEFLLYDNTKKNYWALLNNSYKLEKNKEKLIKLYKQKRKLFNKLMALYDYRKFANNFEVIKTLKKLKNRKGKSYKNIQTDYQILNSMLNNSVDKNDVEKFLKEKSYLFVDKTLQYIKLLKKYSQFNILDDILMTLPLKSLIRVFNYLNKTVKNSDYIYKKYIYIMPHSTYGKDNKLLSKNNLDIILYLNILIKIKYHIGEKFIKNLKDLIYEKYKNENIIYDFDISLLKYYQNIKVPFAIDRSLSNNLLERGSYFNFDDDILRIGIYWENIGDYIVDLDLSVAFVKKDYKQINILSWNMNYILKDKEKIVGVFSGDVVNGKYGAAEFIDVNLKRAKNKDYKYLVLTINNFTAVGKDVVVHTGIMGLNENEFLNIESYDKDKSSTYFNPEKLKLSNQINIKKSYSIVGVIDLEDKIFYPLNIQGGYQNSTSLSRNTYLTYIIDRIKLEDSANLSYIDLYYMLKRYEDEIYKIKEDLITLDENKDITIFKIDNIINLNNLIFDVIEKL